MTPEQEHSHYFRHEVGGYSYEFTLRCIPEGCHRWLREVISAQLDAVHMRAEMNTTARFQKEFRRLAGL